MRGSRRRMQHGRRSAHEAPRPPCGAANLFHDCWRWPQVPLLLNSKCVRLAALLSARLTPHRALEPENIYLQNKKSAGLNMSMSFVPISPY